MGGRVVSIVLMSAVLTGTAVGAAGQSQDATPTAFSGWVHELGDDCGEGSTFEVVGGVQKVRGYRCEQWMGTSDPRFTGTYVTFGNSDSYQDGDVAPSGGSFGVSSVVRRVESEEGAWHADATSGGWGEDLYEVGEVVAMGATIIFTGEGGYEGLTAVVWPEPQAINTPVRGVIFAGAPPPAPSLRDLVVSEQEAP